MKQDSLRILGIDPGSRLTGYGCLDFSAGRVSVVKHGTLQLAKTSGPAVVPLEKRLLALFEGLLSLIDELRPDVMAVEKVFFAKNVASALSLGQARGAVILAGASKKLEIVEYSPTQIKVAVVGHGQADKAQVARMLEYWVGPQKFLTSDASDGLAIALCHARMLLPTNPTLAQTHLTLAPTIKKKKKRLSLAESLGIHVPVTKEARK